MENRLLRILGIKYPILLGGMAMIGNADLALAVSNAGGLGTIAAAGESKETLENEIRVMQQRTTCSFAVNIPLISPRASELVETAVRLRVPVVITSTGNPRAYIEKIKNGGSSVLHVVACADQASRAQEAGVDAVIAEGFESGGVASSHEIGTLALIPQVVDAVDIPVVAAGGIGDARGFLACLALGAQGVSLGTIFLAAKECTKIHLAWRRQILAAKDTSTKIVGRGVFPLRVIANGFATQMERLLELGLPREEIIDFVHSSMGQHLEEGPFPAGQGAGLIKTIRTVDEIVESLISGAEKMASQLSLRGLRNDKM